MSLRPSYLQIQRSKLPSYTKVEVLFLHIFDKFCAQISANSPLGSYSYHLIPRSHHQVPRS